MLELLKAMTPMGVGVLGGLAILIVFGLVTWALREGREVSFWPPRIGARPGTGPQKAAMAAPAELSRLSAPSAPHALPMSVRAPSPSFELRGSLEGGRPLDLSAITDLKTIRCTEHSEIYTCRVPAFGNNMMVLKRTRLDLCDVDAAVAVAEAAPHFHERYVLPIAVWTTADKMIEVMPYVDGFPLSSLRGSPRVKSPVTGALLRNCLETMTHAIGWLSRKGLVHRDLTPFNLYIHKGEVTIIDWSFVARAGRQAMAVGTPGFVDNAQREGRATAASDWFSFAATLYYLANGDGHIPSDGLSWKHNWSGNVLGQGHFLETDLDAGACLEDVCAHILRHNSQPEYVEFVPNSTVLRGRTQDIRVENIREARMGQMSISKHVLVADDLWHVLPDDVESICAKLGNSETHEKFRDWIRRTYPSHWAASIKI